MIFFKITLILLGFLRTHSTRIGVIARAALDPSYATISANRADCNACICDLFHSSMGALNCWQMGNNGTLCQFFALSTSFNITSDRFTARLNSTFIFRSEFTWRSTSQSVSYATPGLLVAGNGTAGSTSGQLNQPSCIYIDGNDDLYICDTNNHRIQKWSKNGTAGVTIAGRTQGTNDDQLNQPLALTFDQFGFLYVVDTGNCRVQRFAPNSTTGLTVAGDSSGTCGSTASRLDQPTGIAIDWNLNLYIADSLNRRIVQYSPTASSGGVSITGRLTGKPYGVALKNRSSDRLYFTDNQKKELDIWANGTSVATMGSSTYLSSPTVVVVDNDDNVYIADETNEQVLKFSGASSTYEVLLDRPSPVHTITGIAFDSQKNLYVTSQSPAGVYKYLRL